MSDSESRLIAGVLPDFTARVERAQLRSIGTHNFDNPNLRTLWTYIDAYYDDHMAIIPEWVLKEKATRAGMSDSKVLNLVELYRLLSRIDVSESEFNAAIDLLKEDELTRRTDEAVVTAREILKGEYYDEKQDTVLRGQEQARLFLQDVLQTLESVEAESAPEGDMKDDTETLWSTYLRKEANPDVEGGIKYGIQELDEFTGGVLPGELVLIAGFTGSGKSHLITSLSWNAMLAGKNVLMFTTETTREEMEVRVIARHSRLPKFKTPGGLDAHEIMYGTLSPQHREVFKETLDDFKNHDTGHLFMVQMPSDGMVSYVHTKAMQYNRRAPIDLIVIDSINLLRMGRKYPSKREMLEEMLQDFKRFASAFDDGRGVAIVSPWQMSRDAWYRARDEGGIYTLASLSDTSEAEKCQPLDAGVLTMEGFKRMGDIMPGESIVGSDGMPQIVMEVHDNGERPIYEVHTNDGSVVECTPGHLWSVHNSDGEARDLTTQEILDNPDGDYLLPVLRRQPDFHGEDLVIGKMFSPAYLGFMLQIKNPTKGYLTLTPYDPKTLHKFIKAIPELATRGAADEPDTSTLLYSQESLMLEDPSFEWFVKANLFCGDHSKFRIPKEYLNGSHHVRETLVRSFMRQPDKDPYATTLPYQDLDDLPYDHPGYGEDLKYLVRSLGWPVHSEPRRITKVVPTGRVEPTKCITVSNPDGLYITDGFVVTHNSSSQIITIYKEDDQGNGGRLNLQVLKNRSGKEMGKVSYPYDYRNSYIGASTEASSSNKPQAGRAQIAQDIAGLMGT